MRQAKEEHDSAMGDARPSIHWLRWYDRYPNIRAIVHLSEKLSPEAQHQVAENMLKVVKAYWQHHDPKTESEVHTPEFKDRMRKGQLKKRWYDHVPAMRVALNLILMIPHAKRYQLDSQLSGLVGYIAVYKTSVQPVRKVFLPKAPLAGHHRPPVHYKALR